MMLNVETPHIRMMHRRVSIRPSCLIVRYVGIVPPEKNIVNSISMNTNLLPGNALRENANAAATDVLMDSTVPTTVIRIVLR